MMTLTNTIKIISDIKLSMAYLNPIRKKPDMKRDDN